MKLGSRFGFCFCFCFGRLNNRQIVAAPFRTSGGWPSAVWRWPFPASHWQFARGKQWEARDACSFACASEWELLPLPRFSQPIRELATWGTDADSGATDWWTWRSLVEHNQRGEEDDPRCRVASHLQFKVCVCCQWEAGRLQRASEWQLIWLCARFLWCNRNGANQIRCPM